ncbi:S41 family peptidase [Spirosoma litoris]
MNYAVRVLLTIIVSMSASYAQSTLTSTQAYEYLQNERGRARMVQKGFDKPPIDSLKKAEQILLDALVYYHRPDVQELAKKDESLFYWKSNVSINLALIQVKLGNNVAAAQTLIYPLTGKAASAYATVINDTPEFAAVRKNPTLIPLLAKAQAADRIFNSTALKTPYKSDISEDEKVAGLSKLWSEAKYNFAYFDHIPDVDWDKLYLDYLPKIRATRSTVEYMRVLQAFCAQLHDGHTDVWASDATLADSTSRQPPIVPVLIDGKVLIQEVRSDSLEKTGIRPMLELVSIDGLPIIEYANRFIRPYQSGSTLQNIDVATYTYQLLRGPKDKPVAITFREPSGKTFSRVLPRTGYSKLKPSPAFNFRILPGNVAYVQLNNFENDQALKGFKAAFDSIATTNALILDVRLNDGGDSDYGWDILGYLTDKPMKTDSYSSRIYSPLRRAQGENVVFEPIRENSWPPNGKSLYTNPVIVLISAQTFSAAEDFAVAFDAMKRGTIIGEPTRGSTGQPLAFSLPGGVMARVCTKRDMYPDGTEWNAKGIQPAILVKPTAADWQAGRDTVLEAALNHLGVKKPVAAPKKKK